MDTKTIVMCVFALILGMLLANMLKSVCGCKTVEGQSESSESSESLECQSRKEGANLGLCLGEIRGDTEVSKQGLMEHLSGVCDNNPQIQDCDLCMNKKEFVNNYIYDYRVNSCCKRDMLDSNTCQELIKYPTVADGDGCNTDLSRLYPESAFNGNLWDYCCASCRDNRQSGN